MSIAIIINEINLSDFENKQEERRKLFLFSK